MMKILLISFYFPPYNTVGAVRVGKFAEYLNNQGHEVRVISARKPGIPMGLDVGIPSQNIHYSHWLDVNHIPKVIKHLLEKRHVPGQALGGSRASTTRTSGMGNALWSAYKAIFNNPDFAVGWLPFAASSGRKLLRDWQPDLVYASGLPFSALIVGRDLARRQGVPFVAELRDLWVDNHYPAFRPHVIRKQIDQKIEDLVLSSASRIITVSNGLASILEEKGFEQTRVVYSGFDERKSMHDSQEHSRSLTILYTGKLYVGHQDPSPLFAALKLLGPEATAITIKILSPDADVFTAMAREYSVGGSITIHPMVDHHEALRLQSSADLLLFLAWDEAKYPGILQGKLFEYLGARKPIIGIGDSDGEASKLITGTASGFVSSDPKALARYLRSIVRKHISRTFPLILPDEPIRHLTRSAQLRVLESDLLSIVKQS